MSYRTSLNSRTAGNIIRKQINKALYDAGIRTSTRSGNKELKHLINRAVATPITENSVATQLGEILGQDLVLLSQEKGKSVLDKNVVLTLMAQDILSSVPTAPASQPEVATLSSEETEEDIAVPEEQDTVPTGADAVLDEAESDEAEPDDVDNSADSEPAAEEEDAEEDSEPVEEEKDAEEDDESVEEEVEVDVVA